MADINIDRKKLAEYLKAHADTVAQQAELTIDTDEVKNMSGVSSYKATVRLYIENIPLEVVEVKQ